MSRVLTQGALGTAEERCGPQVVEQMRERYPGAGTFATGDAMDLDFSEDYFDLVRQPPRGGARG